MAEEKVIALRRYPIVEALDWQLYKKSLREELVDRAGDDAGSDASLGETWWGIVDVVGTDFVVKLYPGEP